MIQVSRSFLVSLSCAVFLGFSVSSAFAEADVPSEQLLESCSGLDIKAESSCVRNHLSQYVNANLKTTSYRQASDTIYSKIDAYTNHKGQRVVDSVYSPDVWICSGSSEDCPRNGSHGFTFNIEHSWPQSQLKKTSRFGEARADMFHLFPTEKNINGARSSLPFVDCNDNSSKSLERHSAFCNDGFQPPAVHRGKLARAMFYMAVTYDMKLGGAQEKVLRKWNKEFPVTDAERTRDQRISEFQNVHNPFILHPEWVDRISEF